MKKISVVCADDHWLIRHGIELIVVKVSDIDLVGQASDSASCIRLCEFYQPTVLLLDLNMPGGVVTETIAFVQQISPQTQILILTAHLSSTEAQTLAGSGVAGYMLKEETGEKVVEAIRTVAEGKTWFSQRVMRILLQPRVQKPDPTPTITLSQREGQVLQLMVGGKSDKEMAQILNISARMVRRYLRQVYDKLRVNTRVEAAVHAVRLGLLVDQ